MLISEPASRHSHGAFYACAAFSVSTGAPISGNILALHGWLGLQGWQWIFLLEAAPALVLAAFGPFVLCDQPADARWLTNATVGTVISSALPTFWNLPTACLGAGTAAAGIATINSIGNISGYLAPQLVGVLRDLTGTYAVAMLVAGGMVLIAAALLPLGAAARLGTLETRPAGV